MPEVFTQLALRPGRYHVGGGRFKTLTADDLRAYAAGTRRVLKAGHGVPLLFEHAPPGSDEGAPRPRDERTAQVKHGAGWLRDVAVAGDGAISLSYEVTDPDAARKIREGSIRYVSPELRPDWVDGQGRIFQRVFSHVALTHKPRAIDQGPIVPAGQVPVDPVAVPAMQFSLDDWEPIQMAADKDEGGRPDMLEDDQGADADPTPTPEPENPDMPALASGPQQDQQFAAILEHLRNRGIALPSDTSPDTFQDRLLTALLTAEAIDQQAKADAEPAEEDVGEEPVAAQPPMQYSLADVRDQRIPNRLLAEVVQSRFDKLRHRVRQYAGPVRRELESQLESVQLSVEGELATFTLAEVCDLLDRAGVPRAKHFIPSEAEAAQFSAADHPAGSSFYARAPGQERSPKEVDEAIDRMFSRSPRVPAKR